MKALAAAGGLVLLLGACGGGTSQASPTSKTPMPGMTMPSKPADTAPVAGNAVAIKSFAFQPATLTVHAGTTVTWTNDDEEPHTVTASKNPLHSPAMGAGAKYQYKFTKPGRYEYICSIHPFMHGTVVVKG